MKKNVIILSLLLLGVVCSHTNINAQNVKVTVNVNKQPAWGPTGYDYAGYYYFPDLNIYFDINNSLFYYASGNKWISNRYLPDSYSKYDLYSLYKVVINDNKTPWQQNKVHKKNYSKFKKNKTQTPIRNSQDDKYKTSRGNTNTWVNTERNSNKTDTKKVESSNNNKNKQNNNSKNSNTQSARK